MSSKNENENAEVVELGMVGLRRKSGQNWQAADLCFDNELYDSAASRYYYSTFQAVLYSHRALPIAGADIPGGRGPKHSRVEKAVGMIGKDGRKARRDYGRLLVLRETADYDPEPVGKEVLELLKPLAERIRNFFLSRVA